MYNYNNQNNSLKSRININISTHIGLTRVGYTMHIAFSKLTSCTDKELIKALSISYAVIKMLNNINMYKFISSNKNYLYAQAGGGIKKYAFRGDTKKKFTR